MNNVPSQRDQSVYLLDKSTDWFPYHKNIAYKYAR